MKKEIELFFTALMFYTRIPCPKWISHDETLLNQSTKYFPVIGWIVGGSAALIFYCAQLMFSIPIAALFSIITSILITGAFHEDGFADVCDGFGGGWTKSKILEIMKDSRIGAYGMIGMALMLLLKSFALIELAQLDLFFALKAIIFCHTFSRCLAISMLYTHEYAREDALSKTKPLATKMNLKNLLIIILFTLPILFLFNNIWVVVALIPGIIIKTLLGNYFKKWIEGYTGDCLGATQQVVEVITLLSLIISWKYFL
jgi:adenosylcobinamide-GDP ribazoletransferase